jgi:hypothetical protein
MEEFHVLGIASRPAAFYISYSQLIQTFGYFQFVIQGKANALGLRAVS